MPRIPVLLLCLSLGFGGPAPADDRALLIGVGRYRIQAAYLPGVGADLEMMREVARALGFADSQIKVLADSEATLDGIRDAIGDWLVAPTTAGDRVLFYHSGHGSRIPDASGDESDGSDEALLPFDFEELVGGDRSRLRNVLLDDDLGQLLAAVPAREVVALVDSCHSGTMNRSLGGPWKSKFYRYPGMPPNTRGELAADGLERRNSIVLLSAARPEEDAQTSSRGALFTQGVWRAVRAAEASQHLTLEQLKQATEIYIRQEVGSREDLAHRPMLSGSRGLRSINLFLPARESQVTGTASEAVEAVEAVASPAEVGELWRRLERLVQEAGRTLAVTASQNSYRIGESLELSVVAPADGFLHILNAADRDEDLVVLYPNRYQANHPLRRGETVRVPAFGQFSWPARLPPGHRRQLNLVVAIQTPAPLELGGPDTGGIFRILRPPEFGRSIGRGSPTGATAAGSVVVTIER